MRIIDPLYAILPPESLQRRDHIIKIPFDLVTALPAHLDRKSDRIQQSDRLLVLAALDVRIALSADRDIVHRRHFDESRFILRQIKFFILLLVIKGHLFPPY